MDFANQQQPGQPYKCLVSVTPACTRKHITGAVACVHVQSVSISPGSLASQFKTCVQLLVAPGIPAPAIPICTPETRSWKVCKPPSTASSVNMPPTDMGSQKAHYFRNICA
ncbi:hypothetical protein FSOLCH5_006877 [Fusarium solani]